MLRKPSFYRGIVVSTKKKLTYKFVYANLYLENSETGR